MIRNSVKEISPTQKGGEGGREIGTRKGQLFARKQRLSFYHPLAEYEGGLSVGDMVKTNRGKEDRVVGRINRPRVKPEEEGKVYFDLGVGEEGGSLL